MEESKGKIQKLFYADLIIIDKNYFSVADKKIKSITSKLTVFDAG